MNINSLVFTVLMTVTPTMAMAQNTDNGAAIAATGILVWIFLLAIYFAPSIIAFRRGHPNRWVILVLNFCLGLTLIVWLLCLVWARQAIHLSTGQGNSNGGESGINIFVNDEKKVRIVNEDPQPQSHTYADYLKAKSELNSSQPQAPNPQPQFRTRVRPKAFRTRVRPKAPQYSSQATSTVNWNGLPGPVAIAVLVGTLVVIFGIAMGN
jgi:hypothetical protein